MSNAHTSKGYHMTGEKKTKKCKRRQCRREFLPAVEWQKFCSRKCRDTVSNAKQAKRLRRLKKFYDEHAGNVLT